MAGRTDTGVHALANVVSVDVEGGAAAGARGRGAQRAAPAGCRGARGRSGRRTSSMRGSTRARAPIATASGAGGSVRHFEAHRSLWHPRALDVEALDVNARQLVGRHDFRAFTPTETQHRIFVRVVSVGAAGSRSTTTSLSSRSRPTRSCATWSGRSSGRCSTGQDLAPLLERPAPRGGGPDRAAARPVPHGRVVLSHARRQTNARQPTFPTASSSVSSENTRPPGRTRLRGPRPVVRPRFADRNILSTGWPGERAGYDRAGALSRRALRLRRHCRRLRRDHPRFDAARHRDRARAPATPRTS